MTTPTHLNENKNKVRSAKLMMSPILFVFHKFDQAPALIYFMHEVKSDCCHLL